MFRLDVLQNQWVILAVVGGAALLVAFWVTYQARWSVGARRPEDEASGHEQHRMPRILVVAYVVIGAFVVIYTVMMIFNPPNW
jgi:uncharacterized membrane protein